MNFQRNNNLIDILSDDTTKFMAVFGKVQSGKSQTILDMCFSCVTELNLIPIVILRNSILDAKQIRYRFLQERIEKRGLMVSDVELVDVDKTLKKPSTGNPVYLALANNLRIKHFYEKVYNRMTDEDKKRLVIILDEADEILYHSSNFVTKTSEYILSMRRNCFKFVAVTATIDVVINCEKNCRMCDIHLLDTPEDYKGVDSIDFEINESINKVPKNGLSNSRPFMDNFYDILERKEDHTKMVLVNMEYRISQQDSFIKSRDMFVNTDTGNKIIYMSMNSSSYTISTDMNLKDFGIPGFEKFKFQSKDGNKFIYRVKDSEQLVGILDFFEKLTFFGVKLDTIVLLCRHKAGRGLSFVSSSRKTHITDIISCDRADLTTLYQSMRIFGRFQDERKMFFHASTKCAIDLKTILTKNEQTFKYINEYRGIPISPLQNHLDFVDLKDEVMINGNHYNISEKRLVPKQKGDYFLTVKNTRDISQRYGGFELEQGEDLQQAVNCLFGPGRNIVNTSKFIRLNTPQDLPPVGQRTGVNGKNFRERIREETINTIQSMPDFEEKEIMLDALSNNKSLIGGDKLETRIAYTKNGHFSTYFVHPSKKKNKATLFSDGKVVVINKYDFSQDDVITWHNNDGILHFNEATSDNLNTENNVNNKTIQMETRNNVEYRFK